MTEPGHVAPASPGWWVRTNRVGTNKTGYHWNVTARGEREHQGAASGTYGWVGTAVGVAPPVTQFIGANTNAASSVTIPPHEAGDTILIFAYGDGSNVLATVPAPGGIGGTIPTWLDVPNCANTGANATASRTVYCVATANNHTSGLWGGTTQMIAAVVRNGLVSSPIGGSLESGSTAAGSATAPAVTLSRTDGSSMLLHFFGHRVNASFTAWNAAPTGYTKQAELVSSTGVCLLTKDDTTSDGVVTQTMNGTGNNGYRGATVEIRYH